MGWVKHARRICLLISVKRSLPSWKPPLNSAQTWKVWIVSASLCEGPMTFNANSWHKSLFVINIPNPHLIPSHDIQSRPFKSPSSFSLICYCSQVWSLMPLFSFGKFVGVFWICFDVFSNGFLVIYIVGWNLRAIIQHRFYVLGFWCFAHCHLYVCLFRLVSSDWCFCFFVFKDVNAKFRFLAVFAFKYDHAGWVVCRLEWICA